MHSDGIPLAQGLMLHSFRGVERVILGIVERSLISGVLNLNTVAGLTWLEIIS